MSTIMTRSEQLQTGTLYECTSCGRLEYRPKGYKLQPSCEPCGWGMDVVSKPDSVYHFEAVAQTFYRETGYVRPGKDVSPVVGRCDEDIRLQKWNEWNSKPIQQEQDF